MGGKFGVMFSRFFQVRLRHLHMTQQTRVVSVDSELRCDKVNVEHIPTASCLELRAARPSMPCSTVLSLLQCQLSRVTAIGAYKRRLAYNISDPVFLHNVIYEFSQCYLITQSFEILGSSNATTVLLPTCSGTRKTNLKITPRNALKNMQPHLGTGLILHGEQRQS